jgi:hypothetical protein
MQLVEVVPVVAVAKFFVCLKDRLLDNAILSIATATGHKV